jgi:hypothetical protein
MNFLIVDYDEYAEEKLLLTEEELASATLIYKDLMQEYSEITADKTIIGNYNAQIIIEKNIFKYDMTMKIVYNYIENGDVEVLECLNELGWNFDSKLDIDSQLKKIAASMRLFKTKIDLLKLKYEERFGKKFKLGGDGNRNGMLSRLESDATDLEIALSLGYQIDTKKTSVVKWISLFNAANKKAESLKT